MMRWIAYVSLCIALLATAHCSPFAWPSAKSNPPPGKIALSLSEIAPAYSSFSLWNDYISNDGSAQAATIVSPAAYGATGTTTRLSASATPCNPSATGGYNVCLHAGMLRLVTLSGKSDCSGVTAVDNLNVFQWLCLPSGTSVKIVAVGFREGKYMSDLIDFDAVAFRDLRLTVTVSDQTLSTAASKWYNNTVVNYAGGGLTSPSTVYLVQSDPATQILATVSRTSLLARPGVTLSTGAGVDIISDNSNSFSWFEAVTNKNNVATGGQRAQGTFTVIQNSASYNPATGGNPFDFLFGHNVYARDLRSANGTTVNQHGIQPDGAGTIMNGIITTNNYHAAVFYNTDTILLNGVFANYSNEFAFQANAIGAVLLNTHFANKGGNAINFLGTGANDRNHTFVNLSGANTNGLNSTGGGGAKLQIINYANYQVAGNGLSTGQDGNYFSGMLRVTSGAACTTTTANQGIVSATCAPQGASDFTLSTGINPTSSFVGKISADDSANTSDTSGIAPFAFSNDWVKFENRYRGWGLDGGPFPIGSNQGSCNAANCRIWDWSLLSGDAEYRNLLAIPNGNNTAIHMWSAANQASCTQPGATWTNANFCDKPPYTESAGTCAANGGAIGSGCSSLFLRNAVEILEDGIGNENGLCESNEVCIYTPNIGAYQGHGNLTCVRGSQTGCAAPFSDGAITGVTLMQYHTNGY